MIALMQRLSQLRQQAGAAPITSTAPVKPVKSPDFSDLQQLLARRDKSLRTGDTADKSRRTGDTADKSRRTGDTADKSRRTGDTADILQPRAFVPDRRLPGVELTPGLRLLEQRFPEHRSPVRINAAFARFGSFERSALLHFDTETTGLSGGTGTRAFMIGAADWCGEQLRLRQLFLTTMAAEPAMLQIFSQWLSEKSVLVSYNGRSFDAPLLKARYRMARLSEPITPLRHLDLLFPTRRRYRGRWENCRLATIERQVLHVMRDDDLPGSEAPRAWRDYLSGHSARDFRRVIEHNAQDLLSLSGLLTHLTVQEDFVLT